MNCQTPRPEQSYLLGWTGWLHESRCASCTQKLVPTEEEDGDWVEEHGDRCAWCHVGRTFEKDITGRAHNRRCPSSFQHRQKFRADKTPEEVAYGNKSLRGEWLSLGNRDECGECGKPRVPTSFYGWRENARCRVCYKKGLNNGQRALIGGAYKGP